MHPRIPRASSSLNEDPKIQPHAEGPLEERPLGWPKQWGPVGPRAPPCLRPPLGSFSLLAQWKECGVGEIQIVFHIQKKYYRVLMRRDQVLKVCANHVINKEMILVPSDTSNNALIWMAKDYADAEVKVEQLAKGCEKCQQSLSELQKGQGQALMLVSKYLQGERDFALIKRGATSEFISKRPPL
uniref:RanBD1 domain-containing protein n=1 Tax=Anas platyrhynchos platyrhynchos TaxID=8840 RepID=A0A493T8B7_ANAPP